MQLEWGLIMVAWEPFKPSRRRFLRALIEELRNARFAFGWFADPVAGVALQLKDMMGVGEAQDVRALLARSLLQDVSFHDQLRLLGVRPPWAH
jgi:hypothetical protein